MRQPTSWRPAAVGLTMLLVTWGLGGASPGEAAPLFDHWVSIGPARITAPPKQGFGQYDAVGRLTTIAVNPANPQIIYAASAGQLGHEGSGVWKTTNGGGSWAPIADDLPTLSVAALAVDPTNPDHVYAATTDEGLFHSLDAGTHWAQLDSHLRLRSNTGDGDWAVLLIDPDDPGVLYATSDSNDGVMRSGDGGQSFVPSLSEGQATSLVMDPLHPSVLYAAVKGKGVWKTVDGGAHWVAQTQIPVPAGPLPDMRIMLALSHPNSAADETVYALFPRSQGWIVWDLYSTTDGTAWSYQSTTCASDNRCFVTVMAADPASPQRVYLGGGPFWVSSSGGASFVQVPGSFNDRQPGSAHGDYWELVTDPTNSAVLYAGSDGGIYKSSDHGAEGSWSFIGEGITNAEMYDLALATPADQAIAGVQDSGNIRYSGSLVWDHMPDDHYTDEGNNVDIGIFGGDGAGVAIDPIDASRFYAVFDNRGTPAASLDGGNTFEAFASGLSGNKDCGIWNMTFQIQIHPTDPNTLLESCFSLWRSAATGPPSGWTWAEILPPPAGEKVIRSAVQGDLDVFYAGTDKGHLFAGVGGAGWQQVFQHPEALYVSDLEVDPKHPDMLYGSFAPPTKVDRGCAANAGTSRVYQFARATSGQPPVVTLAATDITGNLPAGLCVNALAIDPVVERTVYAGTNKGVYRGRTTAAGGVWVWAAYNDGMPLADVRDLEVHPVTGHIFAATFGRSAFEVAPQTNSPPELSVPGPQSVDFDDALSFSVSATDADSADTLSFSATGLPTGLALTDNGDRTATVSGTVTAVPNVYVTVISVDDGTNPPVSATVQITVTKEQTVTQFVGPLVIADALPVTLNGRLLEDGTTPIAGRTLTLNVGNQSCTGTTNASGDAYCLIPTVSSPLGPVTVGADFAGDAYYLASSETKPAIVFAFPATGVFVLGDATVATAGQATPLTYWGAQWSKGNALSGGAASSAFKGFASKPIPMPPACGGAWSTEPGNSSTPVASVPAYMGVAVASRVGRTGSQISGDVTRIVVIRTAPGYAPDPAHAGTGTLVALYCAVP
jgi:hypothetical protein